MHGQAPDEKLIQALQLHWFDCLVSCLQSNVFEDSILQTLGKNYSIELSDM